MEESIRSSEFADRSNGPMESPTVGESIESAIKDLSAAGSQASDMVSQEALKKKEAALALLKPHAREFNSRPVKITLSKGIIYELTFKEAQPKAKPVDNGFVQVFAKVLTCVEEFPDAVLVFNRGELRGFVPIGPPILSDIARKKVRLPSPTARPLNAERFQPESYFQSCQSCVLENLVFLTNRDGFIRLEETMRQLVEDNGVRRFAVEMARFGMLPSSTIGPLSKALNRKTSFVRGHYTMAKARYKTQHRTWSVAVRVTKTEPRSPDTLA